MSTLSSRLDSLPPWPDGDYSEYGPVEAVAIGRFQQVTAAFMTRNWVTIPHVTHNDDIDITGIEAARQQWNRDHPDAKLTILPLLIKALVETLRAHPRFNASLDTSGKALILKKYFNIGVAVDTPKGLLVPVVRSCDGLSVRDLAAEVARLAEKAQTKGLGVEEMSGGCMSISSLGHIGGTSFSPIVNAPEVAILGVTRARRQPVEAPDGGIRWQTALPLSLSYDHRVINGADAARFVVDFGRALATLAVSEAW